MPYSSRVKARAYLEDPGCWISYSGMSPSFKRRMDARRTKALQDAQRYTNALDKVMARSLGKASPGEVVAEMLETYKLTYPKITAFWRDAKMALDENTSAPKGWTAFKMKVMLHITTSPQYSYIEMLAPLVSAHDQRNRERTYKAVISDLIKDGLIAYDPQAKPRGLLCATEKGRVFVDAVLTTPLPIPASPEWTIPKVA